MKKILYAFIALTLCAMGAVSCGDSDDDETITFSETAEKAAAGTYAGTFYRVQSGLTDTTMAAGTLVITPTETTHAAHVALDCPEFTVDKRVTVNIAHANHGFVFANDQTNSDFTEVKNEMEENITGHIDERGGVKSSFSIAQRSGRSTKRYYFTFIGTKQ